MQYGDIYCVWIRIQQFSVFKFNKFIVYVMLSILFGFCVEYVNYINIDIIVCSGWVLVIVIKVCVNICKVRVCILQLKGFYYGINIIYIYELYV